MQDFSVEEALQRILMGCHPTETVTAESQQAAGLVTSKDIIAPHALPPFENAGMDGFAVHADDIATASHNQPVTLPVVAVAQAGGEMVHELPDGMAVRIMTGAPVPAGTTAVVPIEDVQEPSSEHVTFFAPAKPGQHVRPAGEDVAEGTVAIPSGTLIRAAEVGLLAALGILRVQVFRRPNVAIISTGNELLPPHEPLTPGKIRDANSTALAVFVADCGGNPMNMGIVRDISIELRTAIEASITSGADMILTSAGASAGDYDVVSSFMHQGDGLEVWRVNLKPGRPLLYGRFSSVPLIGLPGNPASALIVAELFVRPAIYRQRGIPNWQRRTVRARLDAPQKGSQRRHYVRASVEWDGTTYHATTRGIGRGSGSLTTLVRANALLIVPEGTTEVPTGQEVETILL